VHALSLAWPPAAARWLPASGFSTVEIEFGANGRDGRIELNLTGDVLFDFDAARAGRYVAARVASASPTMTALVTSVAVVP